MDTQFYEMLLNKHEIGKQDAEASWDARAKEFREKQKSIKIDQTEKVTELLLKKGLIKGLDVLDIGGGTGRYAIPFAAHANEVTISDISGKMLAYAKESAENAKQDNLQYIKLSWQDADLKLLNWEKRFDLVFASMCPAIKSKAGIDKMSAASRGWCQINQLIEMTDNIAKRLSHELEISDRYDPHNDRDAVQGFFNLLWMQGFEPELTYLKDTAQQVLGVDEALSIYSHRFGDAAAKKGVDLKKLLGNYASDDGITVNNITTLAMILWRA